MIDSKPSTRLYFVDNLKVVLTILVIMHHALITYGAAGGWYLNDPNRDETSSLISSIIVIFNQGFFMALFFFISAYFVPGSYDRKGARVFLKDRFVRLGIPLLIYISIVNPILIYLIYSAPYENITFIEFYLSYFVSLENFAEFLSGNGPLWFVFLLLIYSVLYCLGRFLTKERKRDISKKPPKNIFLVVICLIMSVFTFLVRLIFPIGVTSIFNIQLCFMVQYIIMFILGLEAYKRDWFHNISDSQGNLWLVVVLISIVVFFIIASIGGALKGNVEPFLGGLHWQAIVYATWESFYCMGMCIGLIILFRRMFNEQGKRSEALSRNAYTIYIIHAPVLIFVSVLFLIVLIPAFLKFLIVLPIVLVLCYLISHYIRQIPGAKRVLG